MKRIFFGFLILFMVSSAFGASGDILFEGSAQRDGVRIRMLDAVSASNNGVWVEAERFVRKAFHADAIETGGKVEIMVSNAEVKPADAADGVVALTLTPSSLAGIDGSPWRWIKAKKTAGGTPAPSTVIMGGAR